jgi:hypothetical protein
MFRKSESPNRPASVTVVAGFFIVWSLVTSLPKLWVLFDPAAHEFTLKYLEVASSHGLLAVPLWLQLSHALVGLPVMLASAIFMQRGKRWAAVTLLLWILGALVLTLLVAGLTVTLYLKLVTAAAVTILLTWPKAWAYFSARAT